MAIPKITRQEEQVLLSTGLLDFPLSPLTLQEMALLDGPSSPSDCLIPACENLSLAPFSGSGPVSPKTSVPAAPLDELGSDTLPSSEVPNVIAPKSLAQVNSHWETMPHVREVSAPTTIEFKSHEKEELDPVTGKIIRTRVIYPIIIPKESKSACISVPPLSATQGQLNSLAPSPLAVKSAIVDDNASMTTTPRGLPTPQLMPSADRVKPVLAIKPARDVADSADVPSSPPQMPTPPRWTPLTAPTPPISSSARDSCLSPRPVSEVPSPSWTSPRDFPLDEGVEEGEGQFDDAEEGELCTPQRLHPSEQPLPPSPTPSPTPSPAPSQVNQLVQHILELKCSVTPSPDVVDVDNVADLPEAPLCSEGQGSNDEAPMDMTAQGEETSNALHDRHHNAQPPNAGRGALVKQLFTPRGAFAAPQMMCPPPVARKPAKELTALEPSTLPPLLPRTHIRPMTIDYGRLSSSSPAPSSVDSQDTRIRAALDQVTPAPAKLTTFADNPRSTELTLPKPYSLPLTSPVTPVVDEVPVGSPPSPMDSENDLPLNLIPVAELRNTFAPKDASLMTVVFSGPGPQKPGTAVKLLVSTPKPPRRRYGRSWNQRRRAAHAKAREDLVRELEQAVNNRFYNWLGTTDESTDAEVADLLAGDPVERP